MDRFSLGRCLRVAFHGTVGAVALLIGAAPVTESAANPAPQLEYCFVRDTDRWVGLMRGRFVIIGKLDEAGNLIETAKYPVGSGLSSVPPYTLLNPSFGQKAVKAYEFRSGRLIRGDLMPDGNFVPEAGSSVVKFEDYRYAPGATPIWNLPGYFVKKSDLGPDGKPVTKDK